MNNKYRFTKVCFFTFLVFYSFNARSQQGTINYKVTINDKILREKREQNLIIYFDKSSSIELIVKPKIPLSDNTIDELNQIKVIKTTKPYFVYKDFSKGKLVLSDYISAKKYIIIDTLNNFKWRITKERNKIQNFNCKKATILFRGRSYEAWYTEDVPLRNGPWKFCGLPGLIVKIRDNSSDFVYELTGINFKSKFENKIISIPPSFANDKAVTYKEFRSLYKKKLEDNIKLSRVNQVMPDGTSGTVNTILPEKMEKF